MSTYWNDTNQWHRITNVSKYPHPLVEHRACSARGDAGKMVMYADSAFDVQRSRFKASGKPQCFYQFPYDPSLLKGEKSPEYQAAFLCELVGTLGPRDMIMIDTEGGSQLRNPAEFTTRWLAEAERRLDTLAWVYVPKVLSVSLGRALTGRRFVKAPLYNNNPANPPSWSHDGHQYTDRGPMPGSVDGPGDCNISSWTVDEIVARCQGGPAPSAVGRRRRILLMS